MNSNSASPKRRTPLSWGEIAIGLLVSIGMIVATVCELWPIRALEVAGFLTGGVCVWLVVREHIANWPLGLFNNALFLVLFWQSRLFADASLQIIYFAFGVYGWWNWAFGGKNRTPLAISRITRSEVVILALLVPIAIVALREILIEVQGAAPLGDAVTTVLSLAAQYLMTRKRLEHWLFWIAADLIYIPLYLARDLPLTAALYAIFLAMCLIGIRQWNRHR